MSTLVFDIETIGEEWEALDDTTRHMLSRWVDRTAKSDEEHQAEMKDFKEGLGFSPLTGSVVAIGLYDLERAQGAVYYITNRREEEYVVGEYTLKPRGEKEMLEAFWEGAQMYDTFVTFNGRGFDVPFLMLRSAIHAIRPSCDLMDGRYLYQQKRVRHIDLQDQLTFYGAVMRRPSLHVFCRAFGIQSPKAAGVTGDDVAGLFKAGEFRTIAEYNVRDVVATAELYKKWLHYLAPTAFDPERK